MGAEDRRIATVVRRRPGRVRAWIHRLTGVIGWIALVLLAIWRLPESPPWRLPLPLGLLMLAFAAVLVGVALLWARFADRRRRPRQPEIVVPHTHGERRHRVPERVS
jgi:membrane protein implicated in regulation of membrane protease activity